jgi:hypothetical protein
MYLPNAAVTLQGNPTLDNSTCENLIAAIAFNGNHEHCLILRIFKGCNPGIRAKRGYWAIAA